MLKNSEQSLDRSMKIEVPRPFLESLGKLIGEFLAHEESRQIVGSPPQRHVSSKEIKPYSGEEQK